MVPRLVVAALVCAAGRARADGQGAGPIVAVHSEVSRTDVDAEVGSVEVRRDGEPWLGIAWDDLAARPLEPGRYDLRFHATSRSDGAAVQIPPCAGRVGVRVDGRAVANHAGPLVVPVGVGVHDVVITLDVSTYERRIACGERPRVGNAVDTTDGLGILAFESPHRRAGGGRAVVYLPPGQHRGQGDRVLVGLYPWNGNIWTYAAYQELLREASAQGVILLMPSGLGNSLYTAGAEDEVMRAIDALASVLHSEHPLSVSIWGASMGGAGATTVAFHHPDRFVSVTSFFGDSSYDLSTYVRSILPDARAAHLVNALDVVDNARNLPVRLVHGESDATSPIRQSEMLASAMKQRGFPVQFDRVPGVGHSGALVARFLPEVVRAAANPDLSRTYPPERVSYWSVRPSDVGAYDVHIERTNPTGDAFIDIERRADGVHLLRADGVHAVELGCRALRMSWQRPPPIFIDDPRATIPVRYTCSSL